MQHEETRVFAQLRVVAMIICGYVLVRFPLRYDRAGDADETNPPCQHDANNRGAVQVDCLSVCGAQPRQSLQGRAQAHVAKLNMGC